MGNHVFNGGDPRGSLVRRREYDHPFLSVVFELTFAVIIILLLIVMCFLQLLLQDTSSHGHQMEQLAELNEILSGDSDELGTAYDDLKDRYDKVKATIQVLDFG